MVDVVALLLFILPAYVANSAPVLFGGGTPVDFGKTWGGKRVLGDGKTWAGLFSGLVFGSLTGVVVSVITAPSLEALQLGTLVGVLLSAGAMAGDLLGSFTKRQLGMARGAEFFLTDQLLFLAVALAFAWPFHPLAIDELAFLAALTFVLHKSTNVLAHQWKLKSVPW